MAGDTPMTSDRLLVPPREACRLLCVCEKTLWSLARRGEIPVIKIGRAARYSVADLAAWIERKKDEKRGTEVDNG